MSTNGSVGGIGTRITAAARSLALVANIPGIRRHGGGGRLPPGSLGWPVIGETLSYVRNSHDFFARRVAKYGPVFKTHLVFRPAVCFVGPEAYTFFSNQPYFNRLGANPGHIQELLYRHSLPLIDGAEHERMRALVLQVFRPQDLEAYLRVSEQIILTYLERWERAGRFSWGDEYKRLSASICAALLGGAEPMVDNDALVRVLDSFLAGLNAVRLPLIPTIPWTTYGRAIRSRDKLLSYTAKAIDQQEGRPSKNMLAELIGVRDDDGAGLRDEQLRAQVLHMYFAAYGGIYRTLTLLSLSLAQHPNVMERARAEVKQHAPAGPVTLEQLGYLTYLNQVTREVRRHHRIFASTLFDWVTEPFEYQEFHVPEGWRATAGIYMTMQDADVFTQPASFDPDRFDPERAEDRARENSYVPQGGGPMEGHRCPGEDLTTLLMQLVAVLLLRDYTWELPPQNLELDNESSPLPRDGLKVKLTRKPLDEPAP